MVSTSGVAVPELEIARSSVSWRVGKGMSEQSRAGDSAAEVKTSAIPEKSPAPEVVAEQKELVTKGCCVALAGFRSWPRHQEFSPTQARF